MKKQFALISLATLSLFASGCFAGKSAEDPAPAPVEVPEGMSTAVVGAGCFWCVGEKKGSNV